MKVARIAVLAIALGAGSMAALLASNVGSREPETVVVERPVEVESVEVLTAATAIGMGENIGASDLAWRAWPKDDSLTGFIRRDHAPEAIEEMEGAIARGSFLNGEPIREEKLVRGDGSGFLSAILPEGMRAVSTEISPETGAGGFILPNDHVDVILTRRDERAQDAYRSQTVLENVRVLAIDQQIEDQDGNTVVVGRTATLALTPRAAETLTLARQLGTLHLTLRSLVDSRDANGESIASDLSDESDRGRGVTFVRYGVASESARLSPPAP